MQLEIKNLHNEIFKIECEEYETVRNLKEKIAAKNDLSVKYETDLIKLLYLGKVMDDEETIASFSIKPDGFILLVKQKPGKEKRPPKKKPVQGFNKNMGGFNSPLGFSHQPNSPWQIPFQQNSFLQQPLQNNSFIQPFQQNPLLHQPSQNNSFIKPFQQNSFIKPFQQNSFSQKSFEQSTLQQPFDPNRHTSSFQTNDGHSQTFKSSHFPNPTAFGGTTPFATGNIAPSTDFMGYNDQEEAVKKIENMGFETEKAKKALRKVAYNVDLAIEILLAGWEDIDFANALQPAQNNRRSPEPDITPTPPSPPTINSNENSQSSEDPSGTLKQMYDMLQNDSSKLEQVKQMLETTNPAMAEMIARNPQEFLQLLSQAAQNGNTNSQDGNPGSQTDQPANNNNIHQNFDTATANLSPREQNIISRIEEMGFARESVIDAFLNCDRNEAMTANYLINASE